MIIHSFDPHSPAIIDPIALHTSGHFFNTCIVTFSWMIRDHVLMAFPCRQAAEMISCVGNTPIYALDWQGKTYGFYMTHVGSCGAANDVIECSAMTGAKNFVLFGSAGSLNKNATTGKYVIPTAAYRDEGMSYHYAAPTDYIAVPGAETVKAVFGEIGAPYVEGRVWSTDAFYRETRDQAAARIREGCLAVEMEVAGVQAVCDFHGLRLYDFLMTGDVLDGPAYEHEGLHAANHDLDKFYLALEIAKRV